MNYYKLHDKITGIIYILKYKKECTVFCNLVNLQMIYYANVLENMDTIKLLHQDCGNTQPDR